jgi:SAM-dependent methyltransferase
MSIVASTYQLMRDRMLIRAAKKYVTGGVLPQWELSGPLQLELLKRNGCTPESNVLEIGCGSLSAGRHIMEFVNPGCYVGIEPNKWLIDAISRDPAIARLIRDRRPTFLHNELFDASDANTLFDYVISHSVLSHASRAQFELFLTNVARVVHPHAKVIASLRMSDKRGRPKRDANQEKWQYPLSPNQRRIRRLLHLRIPPGNSFFAFPTVEALAERHGFDVSWEKEYREYLVRHSPVEHHDWVVFKLRATV